MPSDPIEQSSEQSGEQSGEQSSEQSSEQLGEKVSHYDMAPDARINALSVDELAYFTASIRDLIGERIAGIEYAEVRRTQLAAIGGALAAIGVALLPLSSATDFVPLRWAYIAGGAVAIGVGLLVWFLFARQTNYPYPFVAPVQTWKWFYHHALPNSTAFGPSIPRTLFRGKSSTSQSNSPKNFSAEQNEFIEQFKTFGEQVVGLSNPASDATQDLKQLYLLHVNELYKNRFLTQLRQILLRGVSAVVICAGLAFLAGTGFVLFAHPDDQRASSVSTMNNAFVASSWTPTGAVRDDGISHRDVEYRVVVTVKNGGTSPMDVGTLVARDERGDPIPAEFVVKAPSVVPPAGEVELLGHVWIAGEDRSALDSISLR